jgi:mono/diheme cytochrome c family protein
VRSATTTLRRPTLFRGLARSFARLSLSAVLAAPLAAPAAAAADAGAARRAFLDAYPVFVHPRCLNCHPAGDRPLQGDRSEPHAQRVKRGPRGLGQYAVRCSACHQARNLPGAHMPRGAPAWHLPPPATPMVFEGRSPGELCRQLKDPRANGRKSLAQVVAHVTRDPLVGWGWNPGEGRTPAPGTWSDFAASVRTWADNGGACPEP